MSTKHRKPSVFIALISLNLLLVFSVEGTSPNVTLKFVMSPETQTIRIGEIPEVILTTRAEGHNLQFQWNLKGPGKFKGDDRTKPVIVYIPPDTINGKQAEVTITVTVTDEKEKEAQKSITFTLLTPKAEILPLSTSAPVPIYIRDVSLREEDSLFSIPPTYLVKPGGHVLIKVDMANSSSRKVGIESNATLGTIVKRHQEEFIYVAPKESDSSDIVTVKIVDQETNEILHKEVFNISIIGESQTIKYIKEEDLSSR